MKITAIYGTNHAGSTVFLARELIAALPHGENDVKEFFLPRDFDHYCSGCGACFTAEEPLCVQAGGQLSPILHAMEEADVLIFASPVYVYHVTGAMKSFLDHFGNRWIIHRPNGRMACKTAVLLTTAGGAGMSHTLRDLKDSMNWQGVGRVFSYGKRVMAMRAGDLTGKTKAQISADMKKLARKIADAPNTPRFGVRIRYWLGSRMGGGLLPVDHAYWKAQGWDKGKFLWK